MASDRARVSYDPSRKWRGVIAQQGRVTVEADWNEAAMIGEERDRQVALDMIGPFGTPDRGYAVTAAPPRGEHAAPRRAIWPSGRARSISVVSGSTWPSRSATSAQPDWLDHSTDPMWSAPRARRDGEYQA